MMRKAPHRLIYACAYFFISALFLKVLWPVICAALFERDLLFFLPMVTREMEGLSFIKLILYWLRVRLDHAWTDYPVVKTYVWLVLSLFGPLPKGYIFTSLAFHLANSGLIYWLCRQLRLSSRCGFLAAALYLTLFSHFDAYIWPLAIQHLLVVFFALLGLNLYLKTDRLMSSPNRWRRFYIATFLANAAASFCRFSIWVLPAMIFSHILFCPEDGRERIRKYNIWMPVFVLYLLYPLYSIVGLADQKIYGPIYCLLPRFINREAIIEKLIFGTAFWLKFSIAFLSGICLFFFFRTVLVLYERHGLIRFLKRGLTIAFIFAAAALLITGGPRRLLIPYNILAPFAGLFGSMTAPLQNALLIDPVVTFHLIPLTASPFNLLSGLVILFLFMKYYGPPHKRFVPLCAWYFFALILLYLWNPAPSRYLIYVSPVFCIVFAGAIDYAWAFLTRRTRPAALKEAAFVFIICIVFCVPNILAIRLADFRGKMTENFFVYDYSRAAAIVKADILRNNLTVRLKSEPLYVDNVRPLVITGTPRYLSPKDDYNDKARWIFMQALDEQSVTVNFSGPPKKGDDRVAYDLSDDGYTIYDSQGRNIDLFSRYFEKAVRQLKDGEYAAALDSMKQAAGQRPHLFNYILPGMKLEDARWITGTADMTSWLEDIRRFHSYVPEAERKKNAYIWGIINREMQDYIQCLFYLSFLEHTAGRTKEGEYWFSQIRFLESDFERVRSMLSGVSTVMTDRKISDFLNSRDNRILYVKPVNYYDRHKFERFIFRLALNG